MDLMHAYCRHADAGDVAGMMSCFTADCTIDLFGGIGDRILRGRDTLRTLLTPLLGKVLAGSHYLSNPAFVFYGADEATLGLYMYSMQRFQPDMALDDRHRWGRYEVRIRRLAEGWRIQDLRLFAVTEVGGDRQGEADHRPWPPRFPGLPDA
jgi:hypothetical protein